MHISVYVVTCVVPRAFDVSCTSTYVVISTDYVIGTV